jgi:hypothetical protein
MKSGSSLAEFIATSEDVFICHEAAIEMVLGKFWNEV